jgi:DNA processing protein
VILALLKIPEIHVHLGTLRFQKFLMPTNPSKYGDLKRSFANSNTHHTMKPISSREKTSWLQLARSENVGKSTFFRLLEIFKSPDKALEYLSDLSGRGGLPRKIRICSKSQAEKELEQSAKFGAEVLAFNDEAYPRLLRNIPDPAPILTVKGDQELFNAVTVAVVGPRNASFNGIAFAKKIALELGQNSIVTVSGIARGIDTATHEASILSGTIGVIAGGIDHIYPKENTRLYEAITQRGLLVSESPFASTPRGGHFVQRNRIISGLSLATIIVEAGIRSGSLTTAKFAADQGREVFAVPGSPFDPRCHGTNRLIKDGANMLEGIDDILAELPGLIARFSDVGKLGEPESEAFISPPIKIPSDAEVSEIREEILSRLNFDPIAIEDIISELQLPTTLVNIALVQLELAEKIEVNQGRVFLRAG